MAETKHFMISFGKFELYHNIVGTSQSVLFNLNSKNSAYFPVVGPESYERIGDKIHIPGWQVNLLFGQKYDRPNVTFRLLIIEHDDMDGTYNAIMRGATQNCLLDIVDRNVCKVLLDRTIKKPYGAVNNTGDPLTDVTRENTFKYSVFVPAPTKKYLFKLSSGFDHNNKTVSVCVYAYDAYGSLSTDNIGYVQAGLFYKYKDL